MLTGGSMSGTWSIRACLTVSGLLVASCVLVVDPPEEARPHCAFAGNETECGACIVLRCRGEVDRCCSEGACGGLIQDVESCAQQRGEACGRLGAPRAGDASALSKCIARGCAGVCVKAPPTSSTTCRETQTSLGTACECFPADPATANTFQCNRQTYPSTKCCAPAGYPRAAGNKCSCLGVSCTSVRDGCSCFLTEGWDPESRTDCGGDVCCQGEQTCRCGGSTTTCTANEIKVATCGLDAMKCAPGLVEQPNGCSRE